MTEPALRAAVVLGSSTGGIGAHVASLAAGLPDRGVAVTVYGAATTGRQFRFAERGAAFVPLEIPASPQPGDAPVVVALRRALRTEQPDVVHAHGLRAGLVASLAEPQGTPLVVTWHNAVMTGGVRGMAYRGIERYVARTATVTLGASADLVRRARELGAADVRLAPVAAPPLPEPARTPAEVRAEFGAGDRPLVLSVGRLHPQKGFDRLIAVAARWRDLTPVPLVLIAGTGPSHLALAAQVHATGAPVLLAGQRGDVPDLIAAADLAVVASVWEARQLFAQEAMRAGLPLVATAVGGIPDLVGDAAVLVPVDDSDALDTAVRDMLADPARRAEYGRRASARAATWPTEADTIDQVAALYRQLAPGGRRPR